ncbi:MAG: radical SAM protein [Methanoregula sp.]|jgi:radical SAM superfamily enzyme YgiQ (UPF0313 family)
MLVGIENEENLGIRSIAAYLSSVGIPTQVQPFQPGSEDVVYQAICRKQPEVIGFSLIFQSMIGEFNNLITFLRERKVTAHFTMGGHFPTLDCESTLALIPSLDSVTRHEGELTTRDLYRYRNKPECWESVPGLAFVRDGNVIITPPRPLIENLDDLPFPVRDTPAATMRDIGIASLIASRGCFYNCSFCSVQKFYGGAPGQKRRTRSPANVVHEMNDLFSRQDVRIFIFKDDDFGMKNQMQRLWIQEFCCLLDQERLSESKLWRISCRADEIDEDILLRLRETGLKILYLGIESGNEPGLATCNKHYHVSDVLESLALLRKADLHYEYGFMLIDPGSTLTSVLENIAFLRTITRDGNNAVQFARMLPYSGTDILHNLRQEGRLKGTLISPGYNFLDPCMNVCDWFVVESISSTFGDRGLTTLLKYLKFDSIVLSRFFADNYNTKKYAQILRDFTMENNELVLSTLEKGIGFIRDRRLCSPGEDDGTLEELIRMQKCRETEILKKMIPAVTPFFPLPAV